MRLPVPASSMLFLAACSLLLLITLGCGGGSSNSSSTTANASSPAPSSSQPGNASSGSSQPGSGSSGSGNGSASGGSTGSGSSSGNGSTGGSGTGGSGTGGSSGTHQTVVYVANMGANNISAFTLAADGSLSPISGSPYSSPAAKRLAISGNNLIVTSGGFTGSATASTFKIVPGGGLAHSSDFPIPASTNDVAANSSNVFVATQNGIYSFTVSNGTLSPVAGSPFFTNDPTADPRTNKWFERLALDPGGVFLFAGATGYHGSGFFSAMRINAGVPTQDKSSTIADHTYGIAVSPTRSFLYRSDDNNLMRESFDASTGQHAIVPDNNSVSNIGDIVIDSSGKYLLAVTSAFGNGAGGVRVFDVSVGSAKEVAGSPFSTGGFYPSAITFDATGHYALIVHGDTTAGTPSNDLSVMSFNSSTGSLKLVGSPHPVNTGPMGVISGSF